MERKKVAKEAESITIYVLHESMDMVNTRLTPMLCFAMRLLPGDDLKAKLIEKVKEAKLTAACIVTCVGSLSRVKIRLAGANKDDRVSSFDERMNANDNTNVHVEKGNSENEKKKRKIIIAGSPCLEASENHEITSLVGTVSSTDGGNCHLHITLADDDGNVIGGHVLDGNIIYTTAEIVVGELQGRTFKRIMCPHSGYDELCIS